jgi:hypothetical protein
MTIIRKRIEEIKPMSQERAEAILQLPDEEIDIVISHTAPIEFNIIDYHLDFHKDSSRDALSFFNKNGHSLSAAIGFARFRF